ncbi:MAG TPA: 23S rRNA (pseudouridine(1915)-N(3))-methyltransferase RlmH [Steroidobacteraceae bacterium]|nr:23S rRNA (pseudouridine(1915)-N(3))-methyltransferase RlmH [Steroidobacteraceae bacterium]
MRVRVIAVGTRMPPWTRSACDEYLKRIRAHFEVSLVEIPTAARSAGGATKALAQEGKRLLGALRPSEHVAVLDERGKEFSTRELSAWFAQRLRSGEPLAFVIGGPDGLAREVLARANLALSLSRLTLPHALARVLLAEQLYRVTSILTHHPYHRDG